MKLVYILGGAAVVLAWVAVGFLFASGPQPEIIVPAEVITKVGFLNISNTMITAWVVMAFIIILSLLATRGMKVMPSGLQNFMEAVIAFLYGQVEEIAGEKNARRFFPVVATLFIFIICSNWFGLLPFFNAIGKFEDVGHEIFHELETDDPHKISKDAEGKVSEGHKYSAAPMNGGGSILTIKSGAKAVHFHVHEGETGGEAFDRYVVFLAKTFADFDASEEDVDHPSAEMVVAAAAKLKETPDAPQLLSSADDHGAEGEGDHHGIESPALHATFTGVDFENSKKLGLVVPYFRGVYSDINNTLALGIIAFFCIEFWGFQSLGLGYLKKFFNLNGINSFVGILELLSEFIRVISFAFRLFGNIFAGEVLILMLTFLVPFLAVDIIYGLELFVGFIQASVFALLVLVFATMASESHEEHHDEEGSADAHHHSGAAQAH